MARTRRLDRWLRPPAARVRDAPFVRQRFTMLATKEHVQRVVDLAAARQLAPIIDRRIGLHDVPGALLDLEVGRVRGKIVVGVSDTRR